MRRFLRPVLSLSVLFPLLLSACVIPTTHRYNVLFTFETPYQGEAYPVFSPVPINIRISVPYPPGYRPYYGPGGLPILDQVILFANGVEIGTAEVSSLDADPAYAPGVTSRTFHAFQNWVPPRAGLYYIQARTILMLGGPVNGDYSSAVQICVVDAGFPLRACVPTITPLAAGTPVPLSAPFSFSTPTFTATPASAADCPPSTYFSETTHRCIQIELKPTKSGGGGCSQYSNASACTSNGCSWDKPSSTCH